MSSICAGIPLSSSCQANQILRLLHPRLYLWRDKGLSFPIMNPLSHDAACRHDWEANGPMVAGLDPLSAIDRLKKFQSLFEVRVILSYKMHTISSPSIMNTDAVPRSQLLVFVPRSLQKFTQVAGT